MSISYCIVPAVTSQGAPVFELYRDWNFAAPFGFEAGRVLLATHADRQILERAIIHLSGARDGSTLSAAGISGVPHP
jgi:hypothetical protein